jgi:hypothetical protein
VAGVNRRLFLLSALALGGCASQPLAPAVPPQVPPPAPSPPPAATPEPPAPLAELEPIYSAVAGREGLTIQVGSNGCTAKADFTFYVQLRGGSASVAFARKHVDTCKSYAQGRTSIAFSWAELGLAPRNPVFVLNPITAWTGPGG